MYYMYMYYMYTIYMHNIQMYEVSTLRHMCSCRRGMDILGKENEGAMTTVSRVVFKVSIKFVLVYDICITIYQ